MLKLYLELEHARFSDQFDYTLDIDPELEHSEFQIPPMMVQPYIENAVWHGLRYRKTKGQLSVSFRKQDDKLVIEVLDNGIGVERSRGMKTHHQKKQKSLGMRNIAQRIALMNELYALGLEVKIESGGGDAENPGTRVEIVAPQKKEIT
jgi:sensor histidine kinase YesM